MTALVVTFDVGSTLIHPDFAVLRNWVASTSAGDASIPAVEYAFRRAIAGDIFSEDDGAAAQARQFFTLCGCSPEYAEAWPSWWAQIVQAGGAGSWLYTSLDSDARSTLQSLRSSGCGLIAASNSNGTLRQELAQFDLLEFFDATFDSADLGVAKPELEFYQRVLSSSPHAERFAHVGDDLIKDVIGPVAAGFQQVVLYDPTHMYRGLPFGIAIHRLSDLGRTLGIAP